ncbi:MAG: hypothetical protein ABSF54_07345 [Bryobacteraceae bacterium]
MKPLQIGILVLVGALGGALIMKFTQRPKAVATPIARAVPVAPPAAASAPAPVPKEDTAPSAPLPSAPLPSAPLPSHDRQGAVSARSKPPRPAAPSPAPATIAQNTPPAQPEPPLPIQQPVAPPITAEPAPATTPAPTESVDPPAPQAAPSVTLDSGMTLPVRLGESLSSEHNQAGDTFTATLDAPLSAGGFVIAEKGAHVEGRVVEAQKSGHAKGKAVLALELTKLDTSDGQHVDIKTETVRKQGATMATGDQVGVVAAAAGIGAIIGALAGGGKGAAIGAGAGGAAGGGGVVATRDKAVSLPTESKIAFRLSAPVTITERLKY